MPTSRTPVPAAAVPRTPLDPLLADGAVPRSFEARYGDGISHGISFGGGGLFFVAWQIAYLAELASSGIDLVGAQRVVGTSAGSLVASVVTTGRLARIRSEVGALARVPAVVGHLAPAGELHPSQLRALELFQVADDAEPETVQAIGRAALAAITPSPTRLRMSATVLTGRGKLSSPALCITAVDTYTAERCVLSAATGITMASAAAASGAVPGLFAPQPIGDRRLMDGGVSGTGVHLDLLAGARRVLVLSLSDGTEPGPGMMTNPAGGFLGEHKALEDSGTQVFARSPESVALEDLMAPAAMPKALAMGARQARADIVALRSFWR